MTLFHYAGIVAVPVLIVGYLAVVRWATRADEQPDRNPRPDA
ncbi:hypothetical protein [Bosea lathyri]|nr:hypothetical protein [Bosea lathyri]